MLTDILAVANIIAIIIIAIIGFRAQWLMALQMQEQWRWIKQALALVCLAWGVIYSVILINFFRGLDTTNLLSTRSWVIRPMILITLSFVAASGIARRKTNGLK